MVVVVVFSPTLCGLDLPTLIQGVSALVTAAATVCIYWVTRQQARLAKHQLELSQQEAAYIRTPHFRVRFARLVEADGSLLAKGRLVTVKLDVLNNGQADAKVTRSHLEFYWTNNGLPSYFPVSNSGYLNDFATKSELGGLIVAGGGNLGIEISSNRVMGAEAEDVEFGLRSWTLYLLGWIGYQRLHDNHSRYFDFCLRFQPGTNRFLPVNDPDYNHDPDRR